MIIVEAKRNIFNNTQNKIEEAKKKKNKKNEKKWWKQKNKKNKKIFSKWWEKNREFFLRQTTLLPFYAGSLMSTLNENAKNMLTTQYMDRSFTVSFHFFYFWNFFFSRRSEADNFSPTLTILKGPIQNNRLSKSKSCEQKKNERNTSLKERDVVEDEKKSKKEEWNGNKRISERKKKKYIYQRWFCFTLLPSHLLIRVSLSIE